jgi:hypothetical protein
MQRVSFTYVIWDGNRVVTAVETESEFLELPKTSTPEVQALVQEASKLDDEGLFWLMTTLINQRSH